MHEKLSHNLQEIITASIAGKFPKGIPEKIEKRLDSEIILARQFTLERDILLAYKIAGHLKELNIPYWCGGTTSNSFLLHLLGITHANPLSPHYRCQNCGEIIWLDNDKEGLCPSKTQCSCGGEMIPDGYHLPQEMFWGYDGHSEPKSRHRIKISINVPIDRFDEICEKTKSAAFSCAIRWNLSETGNQFTAGTLNINKLDFTSISDVLNSEYDSLPFSERLRKLGLSLGTWNCDKKLADEHMLLPVFYDDIFAHLIAAKFAADCACEEAENIHIGKPLSGAAINTFSTTAEKMWINNTKYMFPRGHAIELILMYDRIERIK